MLLTGVSKVVTITLRVLPSSEVLDVEDKLVVNKSKGASSPVVFNKPLLEVV